MEPAPTPNEMNATVLQRLALALIGALAGGTLAMAIGPLGRDPTGQTRYLSSTYQRIYQAYPAVGAGAGSLVAIGLAAVAQARRRRLKDQRRPPSGGPSTGSQP